MKSHFSILGVPVRVDGSFLLLVAIFGYFFFGRADRDQAMTLLAAWVPLVTAAILAHELGHALVGRAFGLAPFIVLHGMGGLTQFPAAEHRALSHGRRFLITAAGPGAGIALGALLIGVQVWRAPMVGSLESTLLDTGIYTTLGWGIFNLIPILPLDGGHLLATALERFFGLGGVRFARVVSIALSAMLAAYALYAGSWFMALMVGSLTFSNWRAYQVERQRRDDQPLIDALKAAQDALASGDPQRARALAEPMRGRPASSSAKVHLAHLLAWSRLLEGDAAAARRELSALPAGQLPDAYLEGRIALALGDPSRALTPLAEALSDRADDEVAATVAEAAAGAGRVDELIALLESDERAARTGRGPLQQVAHRLFVGGHPGLAGRLSEKLFARFADSNDAFNAACALVREGREDEALRWLDRAVEAGLDEPAVLDRDDDVAPLRARPEFAALRARAGLVDPA